MDVVAVVPDVIGAAGKSPKVFCQAGSPKASRLIFVRMEQFCDAGLVGKSHIAAFQPCGKLL